MQKASGQAILPSRIYLNTPPGAPITLYRRLVELTDGDVKPSTLIWNGNIRKAPVMPAIDVKKEIRNATTGGMKMYVSTPEYGKTALRKCKISTIGSLF
jgi:hypothetical protein